MKKITTLFFCIILIFVLILSSDTKEITTNAIVPFVIMVLPTLAPALLLNNLISYSGGFLSLLNSKEKNNKVYNINIAFLIISGLISGTPALASSIDYEINKSISKEDGELILECFSFPSLPFIIALINISPWPKIKLLLTIFIPYLLAIIYFLLKYPKINHLKEFNFNQNNETNIFSKAILKTFKSIILMTGSILFFSLFLIILIKLIPFSYIFYIQGILEFSYPLTYLFNNYSVLNQVISTFIFAFSSISLLMQIQLLVKDISIAKITKKRLELAVISTLIIILFTFIF